MRCLHHLANIKDDLNQDFQWGKYDLSYPEMHSAKMKKGIR